MDSQTPPLHADSGVVDTLQSLIVAFVLAMTFRGFVAEGFVIPTGSMAPTLMGAHVELHSTLTGYNFPAGLDQRRPNFDEVLDPMLGRNYPVGRPRVHPTTGRPRAGDRILVLKGLYSFSEPRRYDVVVFKNPTDPKGEAGNYIKRLIGLPNETVWIADGDVFAMGDDESRFSIQRKPVHVQRALWQPIHHSNYAVVDPGRLDRHYAGPPWRGEAWDTSGRSYRTDEAAATMLEWDMREMRLDDWASYNLLGQRSPGLIPVSDLRIVAGIVPDQEGLTTRLELFARSHIFEFTMTSDEATVRFRDADDPEGQWIDSQSQSIRAARPGRVRNVEFWHVDQSMRIFVDNREVVRLDYEWTPQQRIESATGMEDRRAQVAARNGAVEESQVRWHFVGSPVTLHRVSIDRDLYYRAATLEENQQRNEPTIRGEAFGTHPDNLAVLGDDQFYMLGDNSQASLDSRLWGSPHPFVAAQVDDSPFVVHRDLLLGKAWVVYFPAMYPLRDDGTPVIPDFGRLRYIR